MPSIRRFINDWLNAKLIVPAPPSTEGKSAAGNVDNVKRLRPAFTVALPASTDSSILEPSGNDLQISTNFLAGTVTSPSTPGASSSTRPTNSTSRSVPVKDNVVPSSTNKTFERMGKVCRLSTTPATKFNGLIKASRAIENFMALNS